MRGRCVPVFLCSCFVVVTPDPVPRYLTSSIQDCHRLGQRMLLVYEDEEMLLTLTRAGLIKLCGEHSVHDSIAAAARALNAPVQVFSPPPVLHVNLRRKILNLWRFLFG